MTIGRRITLCLRCFRRTRCPIDGKTLPPVVALNGAVYVASTSHLLAGGNFVADGHSGFSDAEREIL